MYLSVQPLEGALAVWDDQERGWDVRLYDTSGRQVADSGGFATVHEATDLARLTSSLVARYHPLQVHLDEDPPQLASEGSTTVVYREPAVLHDQGWEIVAARPDVGQVVRSRPGSGVSSYNSLCFIEQAATTAGRKRLPVHVTSTCRCDTPSRCGHHYARPFGPATEEPAEAGHYLSVGADYEDAAWWQVVAREAYDHWPLVRSLRIPSRSDAESLAMFVSAVAAEPRIVLYDPPAGPSPRSRAYDQDDSVLVDVRQVLDGEGGVEGWQIRATTPDGPLRARPARLCLRSPRRTRCSTSWRRRSGASRSVGPPPASGSPSGGAPCLRLRHRGPGMPAPLQPAGTVTRPGAGGSGAGGDCGYPRAPLPRGQHRVGSRNYGTRRVALAAVGAVPDRRGSREGAGLHGPGGERPPAVPRARLGPAVPDGSDGTYTQPARKEAPAVGIVAAAADGPWHLQCRYPDGTVDTTSLPYPTYRAADEALYQIGSLNAATADCMLGYRASVEAAADYCPCSMSGWRCEHFEDQRTVETAAPDRGGLSL